MCYAHEDAHLAEWKIMLCIRSGAEIAQGAKDRTAAERKMMLRIPPQAENTRKRVFFLMRTSLYYLLWPPPPWV